MVLKQCDTLVRGMVVTMNVNRDVYTDGYVAIKDGLVLSTGPSSQCDFEATENLEGDESAAGAPRSLLPQRDRGA